MEFRIFYQVGAFWGKAFGAFWGKAFNAGLIKFNPIRIVPRNQQLQGSGDKTFFFRGCFSISRQIALVKMNRSRYLIFKYL